VPENLRQTIGSAAIPAEFDAPKQGIFARRAGNFLQRAGNFCAA